MSEKAKHPLVLVAAIMLGLGTIIGTFAPTKADMADCRTRIALLEANAFSTQDRERLVRLEAGVAEIKEEISRFRK